MKFKTLFFLSIFAAIVVNPAIASGTKAHRNHANKHSRKIVKNKKRHYRKHYSKNSNTASRQKDYMHGTASFYGQGDGTNGKRMANGRVFNANDLFLASHPTLPLGTKLKIIDDRSGKAAYVEVTDRMPKKYDRIIDLSYGAAKQLNMHRRGLAHVTLLRIDNNEFYRQKHLIENQVKQS